MNKRKILPILLILSLFLFISCVSGKKPLNAAAEPVKKKEAAASLAESTAVPAKKQAEKPAEETKVQTPSKEAEEKSNFTVTKELYDKTFEEIEFTIKKLNRIISDKDYEKWVGYLTDRYIAKRSDPDFLNRMSSSAILKRNNVQLKSLKDYFDYVVVPSRANARLDKIEMIDKTHVKAITIVNNTPIILYWLVKNEGQWEVGAR
ncbi:MAG: hypothetical protein GXP33_13465 [Spirochaetes bacterium]|nr:hypothetical protein [Spirochaetota bacterium]